VGSDRTDIVYEPGFEPDGSPRARRAYTPHSPAAPSSRPVLAELLAAPLGAAAVRALGEPLTFDQALVRLRQRPPALVSRWVPPAEARGPRQMRTLQCTDDGCVYVRIDGGQEQRHLTTSDLAADDWKAHI
jgi:hypothetical protein